MSKKVTIIEEKEDYKKAIFKVIAARLQHEKYDGTMSDEMMRLNLERGDAVAAIMHNAVDDTILLIEQFRYPTYGKTGNGWIVELPAGIVEEGEDPAYTMDREIQEETGVRAGALRHIYTFFLSPGGSSERIFLFYGSLDVSQKVEIGGVKAEHEDIRTIVMPVDDALEKLKNREIQDAKTILALQWLMLNRKALARFNDEHQLS
ncbi:MAG: NUDIX hydrolase [Chloroflexota bacterium]